MQCNNCRSDLPEGSEFCPYCGETLDNKTKTKKDAQTVSRKEKVILIIAIVLLILEMAVMSILYYNAKQETIMLENQNSQLIEEIEGLKAS